MTGLTPVSFKKGRASEPRLSPCYVPGPRARWPKRRRPAAPGASSHGDLRDAVLRSFKADLWLTLASARAEIPGLIAAIREGRVNGSAYTGACACLVGTIANVRGVPVSDLDSGASRPAEQWFAMIRPGDKPGDDTGGGFAAKQALEWTLEFCRAFGIDPNTPVSAEAA